MSDLISVLIPTYNRAGMVCVAIDSILGQTYNDIEIIVYDDGSIDKTRKMLAKKYKDKDKIKVIGNKVNKGCAFARNRLLEAASGVYACWQDSDDWSNTNRIQEQYNMMLAGKHIVMTRGVWSKTVLAAQLTCNPPVIHKFKRKPITNASTMFKLSEAVAVPLMRSSGGSDADWLQKMKKKYGQPHVINKILYIIRKHNQRIRRWYLAPHSNPEWNERMAQYKNKNKNKNKNKKK